KKQSEQLNQIEKVVNQSKSENAIRENKSKTDLSHTISNNNCNTLTFEQQIYKQLLNEYRKRYSYCKLSNNEIDNFAIALEKGILEIKKVITSNTKYTNSVKSELLDHVSRITLFKIVKIHEVKKNENGFDFGSDVLIEDLKTKKTNWYYSVKALPMYIVGKMVAVQLNKEYFNKYMVLQ
ncbi:MAG: hypothetical protein LBR55_07015, partial [Bacteroidales bacterium]|nr:hypothetical protein [Bacteroidales bacterium]